MKWPWRPLTLPAILLILASCAASGRDEAGPEPTMDGFEVIAHRGASGYLPEHTLAGAAVAHAMGADYIEQDVLLTKDNVLIVLHDLYLEAVTDVEEAFPGRNREDGHYYAIDFTLEEIRRLRVHERLERGGRAKFPGRFPAGHRLFSVPTLEEEIRLIEGLNQSTGRRAGLYIEPKATAWHRAEGRDLMREVLELLRRLGYASRDDPVYLQTFDFEALRRAREELGSKLRLVQLIGENSWRESSTDFDQLRTDAGLSELARFADGIGPWLPQVLRTGAEGRGEGRGLAARARALGLDVHAYTLRADQLPAGYPDVGSLLQALAAAGVNGVFTDHPDQVRRHLYRGHDD